MTQDLTNTTDTIMVVDDNAQNLQLLFDALQARYRIIIAQDGPSALTRLEHVSPDLLLLDIMMPGMSGFDLYERLQTDYPDLDAPVIFLSALSDTASVVHGFHMNAVDYITKPFRLEEVLARVEKHLTLRRMRRELEAKNAQLEKEIAERKAAEAQLRLMEAAVSQANDGVLITKAAPLDRPGPEIVYTNAAIEQQTGYNPAELAGQTPRLFQGEATDQEALADIRLALERREPIRTELLNYHKAGHPFWVELVIAPVHDDDGQPSHFVSIQRDVTDRKEAEQTLQRAYDSVTRKARRLALLNEVAQMMATITDWRRALEIATGLINRLFAANTVAILLVDGAGEGLRLVSHFHRGHQVAMVGRRLTIQGDWLAERVMIDKQPVVGGPAPLDPSSALAAPFLADSGYLLAVSLVARTQATGLILITRPPDSPFDEEEIDLAETAAGQIAGAVETARLFEAEQEQRRIAESLRQVALVLSSTLDYRAILTKILEQLQTVVPSDGAAFFLPQAGELVVTEARGTARPYLGHAISLASDNPTARVFNSQQPGAIPDTRQDPTWQDWEPPYVRSWLAAPLRRGQTVLGILTLDHLQPNAYSEQDSYIVQTFAHHATIALDNADQVRRTEEAMYEAGLLYRLGNLLAKSPTIRQAVEAALEEALAALAVPQGRLILFDPAQAQAQVWASHPPDPAAPLPAPHPTSPLCRQIIDTGQVVTVADVESDPRLAEVRAMFTGRGVRAVLLVPLVVRGRVTGVLEADVLAGPRHFSEAELGLARAMCDQIATAVENGRLFEAERTQRELAEAHNRELDAFARTVAHDIKNPLGAIFTYCDFMARYQDKLEPDSLREYLQTMHQAARKGVNIVDELLLLAGVRKQTVEPYPVEMMRVLRQAVERLAHLFEEYNGQLELPDDLPFAMGYPPWLEEVWVNYLSNGLKYGGQPPHLAVGAERLGEGTVCFWVQDNGPGLSAEAQATLFTEFTRLDTLRAQGHGLGLSIVRRIVEKLGGRVGVESEPDHGARFFFTLPAVPQG